MIRDGAPDLVFVENGGRGNGHHGFGGEGQHGENGSERRRPGGSDNGSTENGGRKKRSRPGSSDDGNSDSDKNQDKSNDKSAEKNTDKNTAQNAGLDFTNLKDGTYTGTGQGRNGSIEVIVKVKNGKVTSVTVESSREDSQYMNRAKNTVIGEIIEAQSLNVQTVSGATMSSNGIIEAVANALGIEYTNTNSQYGGRGMHRGH